jgi:hypothetical protein
VTTRQPGRHEPDDLHPPASLTEGARAAGRWWAAAAGRGGGVRAVVPGYPGRGLGARRLRPRLLLALLEGVLLLPRFPRDGGNDDLRPLVPALQLRLPRAPLPQGHRSR